MSMALSVHLTQKLLYTLKSYNKIEVIVYSEKKKATKTNSTFEVKNLENSKVKLDIFIKT